MITKTLKHLGTQVAAARSFGPILGGLERRGRKRARLRVLAWHRIDTRRSDDPFYPGLISCNPDDFASQIRFIAANYSVCSMADVVAASRGQTQLPSDSVLLTFDDATVDFAAYAWPVLKGLGLPATVFVPTAFPDQPARAFWWDQLHRAVFHSPNGTSLPTLTHQVTVTTADDRSKLFRSLRDTLKTLPHSEFQQFMQTITAAGRVSDPSHNNVLSWEELRQLDREGLTLAPHTHTHPMLNRISAEDVACELRTSCQVLEEQLGHNVLRALAYPAGGLNESVVQVTRLCGFDLAFTTQRGLNQLDFSDPLRLRRINVGAGTSLPLLRLQLANWGT